MTAGLVLDVLSCVINDSINTGFNSFNVSLRSSSALKKTKTFIYYFCSSLIARAQSETSVPLRVKKVTETQTNTPLLLVDGKTPFLSRDQRSGNTWSWEGHAVAQGHFSRAEA